MRKITEIKAFISVKHLLTPYQMLNAKGGLLNQDPTQAIQIVSIVEDDKRRARPGGGASTQCF